MGTMDLHITQGAKQMEEFKQIEKRIYMYNNAKILSEIMLYAVKLREIKKRIKDLLQEKDEIENKINLLKQKSKNFNY